jgi:RecA/RadA recombinase
MLDGGIYSGEITEIYGHSGAGKTQMCFSFMTSVLEQTEKKIIFIDTDLSFTAKRIKALLNSNPDKPILDRNELARTLSRVNVCNVFDTFELLNLIESISSQLKKRREKCVEQDEEARSQEAKSPFNNLGMIIIDSLTTLLSATLNDIFIQQDMSENQDKNEINKAFSQVEKLKTQFCESLVRLAQDESLVVLVTNSQAYRLGNVWKNACAVRLCVEREDNAMKSFNRVVTIMQSHRQHKDSKHKDIFRISSSGLRTVETKQVANQSQTLKVNSLSSTLLNNQQEIDFIN